MANVILTWDCRRSCSYCFARRARDKTGAGGGRRQMSVEDFTRVLDFLDRSNVTEVRLLGGEPTLHPDFEQIMDLALQRRGRLLVFSGGLMPRSALEAISRAPSGRCRVMLNVNAPALQTPREAARQRQVMARLGGRLMLAYTIHQLPLGRDHLLALLEGPARQAERRLRLGLAHPAAPEDAPSLSPRRYPAVGARLLRLAREAARLGVRLELDCGFVLCMFSAHELAELRRLGARATFGCSPVLDIDPDLRLHHCLPLAGRWPAELEQQTRQQLVRDLRQRRRPYDGVGIYRQCRTCSALAQGRCAGGCLATVLGRQRPASFDIQLAPPGEEGEAADA